MIVLILFKLERYRTFYEFWKRTLLNFNRKITRLKIFYKVRLKSLQVHTYWKFSRSLSIYEVLSYWILCACLYYYVNNYRLLLISLINVHIKLNYNLLPELLIIFVLYVRVLWITFLKLPLLNLTNRNGGAERIKSWLYRLWSVKQFID